MAAETAGESVDVKKGCEDAFVHVANTPEMERTYVQDVYDKIADHFSRTRYAAWPGPESFLKKLGEHCLVADVGCGNGKYMTLEKECKARMIGCDVCRELVRISAERKFECFACDGVYTPFRDNAFDAAISVAVVHHFSTEERRVQAIAELARIVKPGGKVLVTVWAKEQPRFAAEESQDAMVSWRYQAHQPQKAPKQPRSRKNKKHNKKDTENAEQTTGVTAETTTTAPSSSSSSSQEGSEASSGTQTVEEKPVVYQRYYHLFYKGELDGLFKKVPCLTIDISGEEAGNYYIEATKR